MNTATKSASDVDQFEFSPSLGGPLFQLYVRSHLSGDRLELLARRVVVICTIAWAPLLILAFVDRHASAATGAFPFWFDVEVNVKLLIALPALILAEVYVHERTTPLARQFLDCHLIAPEDVPKYKSAVTSALRGRDSILLEVVELALVYTLGLWIWRSEMAFLHPTWYAVPDGSHLRLTAAGYWLVFVSVPIVQFMLLRWYVRLCIWNWLLWKISRLNLKLVASNPDRAGGLGFISISALAFAPLLFAQVCMLSGAIANRVMYEGQNLMSFKKDAIILVVFLIALVVGPLLMFMGKLDCSKRKGLLEYGLLASKYVQGFEAKWIRPGTTNSDDLLGTADIQSLADLGNSCGFVRDMQLVPFSLHDIVRLVVVTVLPLVPLGLLIMPPAVLVKQLFKLLFQL